MLMTVRWMVHGIHMYYIQHKNNLRIIQEYFQPKIGRKIRIFSLGWKNNILRKKKEKEKGVYCDYKSQLKNPIRAFSPSSTNIHLTETEYSVTDTGCPCVYHFIMSIRPATSTFELTCFRYYFVYFLVNIYSFFHPCTRKPFHCWRVGIATQASYVNRYTNSSAFQHSLYSAMCLVAFYGFFGG